MSLYMDVHNKIEGATAEDVAAAHAKDVELGPEYGVRYLKYWFDEDTGRAFCLVEGPDSEAVERVHRLGHGLTADEIFKVTEGS